MYFGFTQILGSVNCAENTHLLHKGKYHCSTADLLPNWFGIRSFAYIKLTTDLQLA